MSNPTTLADIEARFRPLADNEKDSAQALIDDAWAILQVTVPGVDSRVDGSETVRFAAIFVMSAMVLRVLRNPDGVRQWSVDDYSETRDSALSAGSLYVSPDEVALLTGTAGRRRGAFSVATSPGMACPAPGAERDMALLNHLRYGAPWPCP